MPYVLLSDLPADIPPDFLTQALDDDGDGVQDPGLWDLIAQQVSDAIDGDIGVRYAVPLVPNLGRYPLTNGFPPVIVNAGRTLAAEKLYGRRGTADQRNPWASRANAVRSSSSSARASFRWIRTTSAPIRAPPSSLNACKPFPTGRASPSDHGPAHR
jgi:hypothetical protein